MHVYKGTRLQSKKEYATLENVREQACLKIGKPTGARQLTYEGLFSPGPTYGHCVYQYVGVPVQKSVSRNIIHQKADKAIHKKERNCVRYVNMDKYIVSTEMLLGQGLGWVCRNTLLDLVWFWSQKYHPVCWQPPLAN